MPATKAAQIDAEHREAPGEELLDVSLKPISLLRRFRLQIAGSLTVITVLLTYGIWNYTTLDDETGLAQQQLALKYIDDKDDLTARQRAREIAERLLEARFRDPNFPGALEFILGLAIFRDAQDVQDGARERDYLMAARYLLTADKRALAAERRPEWAYALGVSLFEIGSAERALPLLEEAVETYTEQRNATVLRLTDIYLDEKTPEALQKALKLNTEIITKTDMTDFQHDRAYLQRAQLFLSLNQSDKADEALQQVSAAESGSQGTIVFRAQTLMAKNRYLEAINLLKPVATHIGLNPNSPRQAAYLLGVCYEQMHNIDEAIAEFNRTAQKYPESHEALASSLKQAKLLQQVGRHEEALDAFRYALRMSKSPQTFRNRWLNLKDCQDAVLNAWNSWVAAKKYQEAILISSFMPPLIPKVEASELSARAHQHWAEQLERTYQTTTYPKQQKLYPEMRERWRLSGEAFATFADSLQTSPNYADMLWRSALHYHKGRDLENALKQFNAFIGTHPKELLPSALLHRGNVLMDMDRLQEALQHYQDIDANYPTDAVAFEAKYLIGKCYLEQNDYENAKKIWNEILSLDAITPAANEWRLALFSLGRLHYYLGNSKHSDMAELASTTRDANTNRLQQSTDQWTAAIRYLEEYVLRYPESKEIFEARYLLAMSLQKSTIASREKLKSAETENARMELQRTIQSYLSKAVEQFETLQSDLLVREELERINDFQQRLLRDCFFELAHANYALGQYPTAIVAYSSAANRYPQDPQVLLAYIQMTNCYDRLGRPAEARSMIEQAKVILKQMKNSPEDIFNTSLTNLNVEEWENWLDWARRIH